jgi:hypothetical protein
MNSLYAKIDMATPGNGVGTIVNMQMIDLGAPNNTLDPNFTWVDTSTISPQPSIGWTYNGSNFISPPVIPSIPLTLNQQYPDPSDFGQYVIDLFTEANNARGLTSSQTFSLAQTLLPYFVLLQTGSIQTVYDSLSTISVDGVIITQGLISQFQALLNQYLTGG